MVLTIPTSHSGGHWSAAPIRAITGQIFRLSTNSPIKKQGTATNGTLLNNQKMIFLTMVAMAPVLWQPRTAHSGHKYSGPYTAAVAEVGP
jgi:hypothetical protein